MALSKNWSLSTMKFMDRQATNLFLAKGNRGPTPKALDEEFFNQGFYQAEFMIPVESGKVLSLFRHIFHQHRTSAWTMIIMQSAGIWPSWEDINLTAMMRQARGGDLSREYGEGYLFAPVETADMISFAYVFANFRYDFRIIDADREIHAFFSHDDWFFIQVSEKFSDAFTKILDYTKEWPRKSKKSDS
jgi:hypothetical protein